MWLKRDNANIFVNRNEEPTQRPSVGALFGTFPFLKKVFTENDDFLGAVTVSTFKLLVKKDMLLISLLIAYSGSCGSFFSYCCSRFLSGLELQMWSSNYPTIFGQYFDAKVRSSSFFCF